MWAVSLLRPLLAGAVFFPGLFLLLRLLLTHAPLRPHGEQHATILSARLVSCVQAVMASSAGYIISSSCHDVMEDQHWLTSTYILFAVPYFLYDIYAMFLCHWYKSQVKGHEATPLSAVIGYLRREFLMVLHHVVMVTVCFPVSVFLRQGIGDYFQGVMFMAELSTPSVCLGKILIQYKKQHTLLYKLNGVLMLATFFTCRVLLFPYLYYAYSRYASIPLYLVPVRVPWVCNAGAVLLMAPQLYWFGLISQVADTDTPIRSPYHPWQPPFKKVCLNLNTTPRKWSSSHDVAELSVTHSETPHSSLTMASKKSGGGPGEPEGLIDASIIRIPPHHYIHVLDQNTNIARVEIGPLTYIRQDNERVLFPPLRMIMVPPRHYCVVLNPVARDDEGRVQFDQSGQAKLRHADLEIRLTQEPFPLYPGEDIQQDVTALQIVYPDTALRLQALLDFKDSSGQKRIAGDEWLFEGPGTYIPCKEVAVLESIKATVIRENQAIRLRARKEGDDRSGVHRVTGEEWQVSKVGAYLPGAHEEVVDIVNAYILTDKKALHVRAVRAFRDAGGRERRTGEEWLVTMADREAHIPSVSEEVVGVVPVTTLNSRQYAVILDPVGPDGKPQLGQKRVVKGERSFFLQPGERLELGTQDVYILSEDEGLLLRATEAFTDAPDIEERREEEDLSEDRPVERRLGVSRRPGDRWMLRGPMEYVPPATVEVVLRRQAIPLDENEGIYVRDIKTGKVRAVIGQTYMLNQDEELWEKTLPPNVEQLLMSSRDPLSDRSERRDSAPPTPRDRTRVVSYRVPHNAAVQVYDYREKKARVVFGPELVMLGPDEQFTVLSLSGEKPKRANVIKAVCLLLGPDFCTDIITIETADHARLQLQLAYNWHFEVKRDVVAAASLFSVPDFVGDACKAIASRIRGAVASVQFDDFHKNSNRIICSAVFGFDEKLAVRSSLRFPQNGLVISSVDIQSVEPVDQRTRDALQKSVQLAIEITTNSQEATARHEAERLEQEARGRLERQRITDQAEAERARKELLELEALSAAVESTGAAKAEAQSRAEAARIQGEAAVNEATLKAEAQRIEAEAELARLGKAREAELSYQADRDRLEVSKREKLAAIEAQRFQQAIQALGSDTLKEMARAGPELQVKLLQSLGLKSTLITDGSCPINLFGTANGLLGALQGTKLSDD
ncbi:hypothetical protein ACEWY4_026484 [Coilia grayii]|uniref:Major vault protein n=1 Tax=Coilia grayii TaxID=363190 RepID=A0ABD1IVA5_9TELE